MTSILTSIVQLIRSFFLGPKRLIETNISKQRDFHHDKSFWPLFLRNIKCDRPQESCYKYSKALLTSTVELIRAFLGHNKLFKTKIFEKRGYVSGDKGF